MRPIKIVTIVGARPQFIKAAVLSRKILSEPKIEEIIVHTGQHFDSKMSSIFFKELLIPTPKYFLDINLLSHGAMTGRMLEKIESILFIEKPDWVLVYGDTNSTLAGALAAKKLHIKLAHVEAGLRSNNHGMPEEINRVLTDRISDLLFCPTKKAVENLKKEGIANRSARGLRKTVLVGDIMFEGYKFQKKRLKKMPMVAKSVEQIAKEPFILATIHREENVSSLEKMSNIVKALNEINKSVKVVVPAHPRTKKILDKLSLNPEFKIIGPLGYLEMIYALDKCELIITDSGGIQKEAYFSGKFCITLRDETEWIELVNIGANFLVGDRFDQIMNTFNNLLGKKFEHRSRPYGRGNTSCLILKEIKGIKEIKNEFL